MSNCLMEVNTFPKAFTTSYKCAAVEETTIEAIFAVMNTT